MQIRDIIREGFGSNGSVSAVITHGFTPDQTISVPASGVPAGAILLLLLFTELQPR